MVLSKLLENVDVCSKHSYEDVDIQSLSCDSRVVNNGGIFFAISGYSEDGKKYIGEAIKNGAIVVVTDSYIPSIDATQIVVNNVRKAMSIVAKNYYKKVCDKLRIISIVGTAGKTTTSMILSHILNYSGNKCAVIGTNGIYVDNTKIHNTMTTPDPIELHRVLKLIYDMGIKYVAIEVSAQAIYLDKMYGIKSVCGVFTNVSNEHLDFFKNIEDYAKVKCSYFTNLCTHFRLKLVPCNRRATTYVCNCYTNSKVCQSLLKLGCCFGKFLIINTFASFRFFRTKAFACLAWSIQV